MFWLGRLGAIVVRHGELLRYWQRRTTQAYERFPLRSVNAQKSRIGKCYSRRFQVCQKADSRLRPSVERIRGSMPPTIIRHRNLPSLAMQVDSVHQYGEHKSPSRQSQRLLRPQVAGHGIADQRPAAAQGKTSDRRAIRNNVFVYGHRVQRQN